MDTIELIGFTVGPFEENPYLLIGPSGAHALLIDPGLESEPILDVIEKRRLAIDWIVCTHAHLDHVACNAFFHEKTGAEVALHPLDLPLLHHLETQGAAYGLSVRKSPEPALLLADGVPLRFDGLSIDVMHTPGHSPGSVCLGLPGRLIVGDLLFRGSVGRTDLPGGSHPDLVRSIRERVFPLPPETACWPGHGPETTIGHEKRTNPFVSDAALLVEDRS